MALLHEKYLSGPLIQKITCPFSTEEVYGHLKDEPYSFFLDSGNNPLGLGRYSFIGFEPFLVFKATGTKCEVLEVSANDVPGQKRPISATEYRENPFDLLKKLLAQYELPRYEGLPPFLGGAAGYFSYDLGEVLEKLPDTAEDDLQIPHCILGFYDTVLIYDHVNKEWLVSSTGFPEQDPARRQARAVRRLKQAERLLLSPPPEHPSGAGKAPSKKLDVKSHFSREEYCAAVQKCKDYIAAGDIFQVNMTQRFETDLPTDPYALYKILRKINPAPFASFLKYPEVTVASASPERFLLLTGDRVETRPIKGTRPRGSDPESDRAYSEELISSPKDRAELVMIIDLERNDLGRVCETGSVKVPDLIRLEEYATVFHLVSTVEGKLPQGRDITDVLRASFPGGSITGAPKIRSMEIIDELEPVKRGIYTGSVGYISFNGDVDLNIIIRTFIIKDDKVYWQVGGGIVADSDPEAEYEETLTKGKALKTALEMAAGIVS